MILAKVFFVSFYNHFCETSKEPTSQNYISANQAILSLLSSTLQYNLQTKHYQQKLVKLIGVTVASKQASCQNLAPNKNTGMSGGQS